MTTSGYRHVADDLRAAIGRGDYSPGAMLPPQDELAEHYGLNRNTIRRAVNLLHAQGLVDPIRGHGTRVRRAAPLRLPLARYTQTTPEAGPWETACATGGFVGITDLVGVSELEADPLIAHELGLEEGARVIRRTNRMRIADRVLQLQDTWLPYRIAHGTPLMAPTMIIAGIYRALAAAGHQPAEATETVTGRMPTPLEAEALGLRLGSPILDIRRTTPDHHGTVLVHTQVVVAADHISLVYRQPL
jgi:GntR family transcriptional regulator